MTAGRLAIRRCRVDVILAFVLFAALSMIALSGELWTASVARTTTATATSTTTTGRSDNRTRVILLWTTFFGEESWFYSKSSLDRPLVGSKHCPYSDCVLTADRTRIREADVLLFHYKDPPYWPSVRYERQYYAHFIHEPPGPRGWFPFVGRYEGRINLTINFRRDADLYVPYSALVPTTGGGRYEPRIPLAAKRKMVVWPVSHCRTASRREDYVGELAKYVDVDVYGKCGTHRCPRSRTHGCLDYWQSEYKFYLAFENNICDDYITEKMFQPLEYELIPVVLGGGNYSRDAPTHSVIDARDFDSPKDLAEFLVKLAADEQRYYSYFRWKTKYETVPMPELLACGLCEALHKNTFGQMPAKTNYTDYWYGVNGEKCDNELVPRMRKAGRW